MPGVLLPAARTRTTPVMLCDVGKKRRPSKQVNCALHPFLYTRKDRLADMNKLLECKEKAPHPPPKSKSFHHLSHAMQSTEHLTPNVNPKSYHQKPPLSFPYTVPCIIYRSHGTFYRPARLKCIIASCFQSSSASSSSSPF